MAIRDTITDLIDQLSGMDNGPIHTCQGSKRRNAQAARDLVWESDLPESDRRAVYLAIGRAANPTGYHYDCTGIAAGIEALKALLMENQAPANSVRLNARNLRNLVSDGAIFSVEFVKRSDGNLRKMICRTGVKRYLKGTGAKYNAAARDLLPVYDMEAKGYRSVPVDAIRTLTVGGQTFSFPPNFPA